jgi:phosphoribosylaminoimidazolecarboxamide formyltransferase/IMP cyclohydrolase
MIERALFSVYDKTGLVDFARGLADLGVELVASGGTAGELEGAGLEVARVESLTEYPELFGGRVKTLHPRVHGAILARRDSEADVATMEEHGIRPLDLVCVNLYPFQHVVRQHGVREEDAVEMIDVGGPALLRAAAKNFAHVAPVCRPDQYDALLEELRESDGLSIETRRLLATEAFTATAAYEATIAGWFADRESFPTTIVPAFRKVIDLAYGENPHQRAAYYADADARTHLLAMVEQIQGRDLSYNNLNDLSAARLCLREFAVPACVIVKHANPCGVAVGRTIDEAYDGAFACDPISAYGGVVALNRPVEAGLAERISEQFVELLFAPGYGDGARDILATKPGSRVLLDSERRRPGLERDYKRVLGGVLVQDRDWDVEERDGMIVVCGDPE